MTSVKGANIFVEDDDWDDFSDDNNDLSFNEVVSKIIVPQTEPTMDDEFDDFDEDDEFLDDFVEDTVVESNALAVTNNVTDTIEDLEDIGENDVIIDDVIEEEEEKMSVKEVIKKKKSDFHAELQNVLFGGMKPPVPKQEEEDVLSELPDIDDDLTSLGLETEKDVYGEDHSSVGDPFGDVRESYQDEYPSEHVEAPIEEPVENSAPASVQSPTKNEEPSQHIVDERLDDLRKEVPNWSLASDSNLLSFISDWSARMKSKTLEVQNEVKDLSILTSSVDIQLHNTFNSFLLLSNSQFVENRVYDEDETLNEAALTKDADAMNKELTKEEAEAILIPKYREAISYIIPALDMYTSTRQDLEEQDFHSSDDDGSAGVKEPSGVMNHVDEWSRRPLPFIIGTRQFEEDDHCGLRVEEYYSDDEEEILEEDEHEEADEDEVFYSSDEEIENVNNIDLYDSPVSDREDHLESYEHPENEYVDQHIHDPEAIHVYDEIKVVESVVNESVEEKPKPKVEDVFTDDVEESKDPFTETKQTNRYNKDFSDLFEDEDESLFLYGKKKTNLFEEDISADDLKKRIFDDDDLDFNVSHGKKKQSLFDDDDIIPAKTTKKQSLFEDDDIEVIKPKDVKSIFDDDDEPSIRNVETNKAKSPVKDEKKPNIFDEEDDLPLPKKKQSIFDDEEDTKPSVKETKTQVKETKKQSIFDDEDTLIAPNKQKAVNSIFDDEDVKIEPTKKEVVQSTTKSIFDDEQDIKVESTTTIKKESVFDDKPTEKPSSTKSIFDDNTQEESTKTSQNSKVSKSNKISDLQDKMNIDVSKMVPGAKLTKKPKDDDVLPEETKELEPERPKEVIVQKIETKKESIFDNIEETKPKEVKSIFDDDEVPKKSSTSTTSKAKSIFDDDDDNSKVVSKPNDVKSIFDDNKVVSKPKDVKSIFDDDEEPKNPPTSNISKAKSIFDDNKVVSKPKDVKSIFDDDEESKKPSTSNVSKAKSIFDDDESNNVVSKPKEVKSVFDDMSNNNTETKPKDVKSIFEEQSNEVPSKEESQDTNQKSTKISNLQKNLNIDVSKMVPGARMAKKDVTSIFDDEDSSEKVEETVQPTKSNIFEDVSKSTTTSKSKVKSIFDDDVPDIKPTTSKVRSIFDDDDTDVVVPSKQNVKSIFDDDDDDKSKQNKVSSLQKNLNLNVTSLMPGSSLPQKEDASSRISNIFDSGEPNHSESVNREGKLLDDPNLTRAKQSGRRPPSRLRK